MSRNCVKNVTKNYYDKDFFMIVIFRAKMYKESIIIKDGRFELNSYKAIELNSYIYTAED